MADRQSAFRLPASPKVCRLLAAVRSSEPPLPECLTRLLAASPTDAAAMPGQRPARADDRPSMHAALEAVLLRGCVYGVSGLVWLFVTVLVIRHLAR